MNKFFIKSIILTFLLVFFSCSGRVPTNDFPKPTPINSNNPSIQPSQNPSDKPPQNEPPNDGADLPIPGQPGNNNPPPNPPDPNQPRDVETFFELMKRFGFKQTKEEITADIKKLISTKISGWSKGKFDTVDKNILDSFKTNSKYFKPPLKDVNEYKTKSIALANKKENIDFYLDVTYGPKSSTIYIQKVDNKTLEVLMLNRSGLITNYTQTDGSLLRLAHFMKIPPDLYLKR
ncbi:MAG: hypothetical protein KatS3mg068_0396 [Candidatus Sericytochromatia bacterium]|nr:MAG: hypothetical protein KatS3mg068_0396 [Candidatus Sericytochromatia bacterium]